MCVLTGCARQPEPPEISINAKSAVIIDARKNTVLYSKDPDKRFPPASTAKVMTAVVAAENAPLSRTMRPGEGIADVEPTVAGLKPGVEYRLKDLIAAILIQSANDAAIVIAEGIAGSEADFAALMNNKAREIGMEDTYFANASGLPTGVKDSQYTTANDLARLMQYAKRKKIIVTMISKKEMDIRGGDGEKIELKTHNKVLLQKKDAPWGKTGYTREAKRTFVGMDPSSKPHIVFALLQSNELWSDIIKLNINGLEAYHESRRTIFSDIMDWVKSSRERGREAVLGVA